MVPRRLFSLILLPVLVGLGCGRGDVGSEPPNPDVVASYNGGVITKDLLKAKFNGLMPCCKSRYPGIEGGRKLIKEMVLPMVIAKAVREKKIDLRENLREELGNVTDELNMSFLHMKFHEHILEANEKYQELRESYEYQKKRLEGFPLSERFGRLVQLHERIHPKIAKEVEKVAKDYVRKLRNEASITKNYDVLRINVTEDELRDFYQQHKEGLHSDEYRVPQRVRVEQVRIQVDKEKQDCPTCSAEERAEEMAQDALIELRSGADFQTVAQRYASGSQESTESRWFDRGSNGRVFDNAVFSLELGETSEVFKKGDSFYIVRVLEKEPGYFKPFERIRDLLEREYRWQKGENYLKENTDRILFTINARPYTIGDFIKEYTQNTPPHECHHMEGMERQEPKGKPPQLCDFAHNEFEDQKGIVDRMIDKELILEDTYNQMIHVEHQQEIELLTMASLYPIFHREEMENLIQITDEMVEDYFRKNREDYQYPAKAKISMIVVRGGKSEEEKQRASEKAMKAYKELKPSFFSFKRGRDFAEVAREYSEDEETASRGGRLELDMSECRNAVEYMLFHGFHKTIFALKPGEISDVFEFGGDFYLVQIREMESRKDIPYEEVKETVRRTLLETEHQKVMEKWEDGLLKSDGFVVYDQTLEEVMAEVSAKTEEPQKIRGS